MKKLLLPLLAVVCLVDDTSTRAITATTTTATTASQLGNISTRGLVQTGANVMIGGFIIQGTVAKTVIVRAIGPSLTQYGVPGALVDPTLELHDSTGVIATNDNWQTTQIGGVITADQVSAIQNSGKAPSNATESAIIATLQPGNYTVIVGGKNNTTEVALVEVYDLSSGTTSILGNISTRGFVQTGANVMIGGFIIQGTSPETVIVRAIGPSLTQYGVPGALVDPTLELHDSTGVIATNDNWQTTQIGGIITADQVSAIQNSGKAPSNATESAIIATLQPGNYTAIVGGKNNTTGVALVEVYDLSSGTTSILGNTSTRGLVQTGANVMIGGFIIQGTSPETVIVRAIGPSLTQYGVPGALVDPTLELHDSTGVIATNDNWQTTQIGGIITADQVSAIQNSGKAPSNESTNH